jgi:hypothetical protein
MELIQDITEHILILKCKEALNRGEEFSSPKIRKKLSIYTIPMHCIQLRMQLHDCSEFKFA